MILVCKRCGYKLKLSDKVCPACSLEVEQAKTKNHKFYPVAIFLILLAGIIIVCGFFLVKRIHGVSQEEPFSQVISQSTITQSISASATQEIESTTNPQENLYIGKLQIIPFSNDKTNVMSYRGYVDSTEDEFNNLSSEDFNSFVSYACSNEKLQWVTVSFGDETGIVFSKDDPSSASYGKTGENGKLSTVYGMYFLGADAQRTYHLVLSEETTAQTEVTEISSKTAESPLVTTDTTEALTETTSHLSSAETSVEESSTQPSTETTSKNSQTTISESESSQKYVYITPSGTKFHKSSCSYLGDSKTKILRDDAIKNGYTACSRCKP